MRRITGKVLFALALLGILTMPGFASAANAEPALEGVLRSFYQAFNRGDAAAAAAFFTDDGVLVLGACAPAAPCIGKADVQRGIAQQVTQSTPSWGILSSSVSGNTVTARVETWNINVQALGLRRVLVNASASFSGDKMTRLVHELDTSDSQTAQFTGFRELGGLVEANTTFLLRGDAVGILGLYRDDAVFEGFGLCASQPCRGKDAIQWEVERQVADHLTVGIPGGADKLVRSARVSQKFLRSDSIRAAGVDRLLVEVSVEGSGGRITWLRWTPIAEDAQTAAFLAAQNAPSPVPQVPAQLPTAGQPAQPLWLAAMAGSLLVMTGFLLRRDMAG